MQEVVNGVTLHYYGIVDSSQIAVFNICPVANNLLIDTMRPLVSKDRPHPESRCTDTGEWRNPTMDELAELLEVYPDYLTENPLPEE